MFISVMSRFFCVLGACVTFASLFVVVSIIIIIIERKDLGGVMYHCNQLPRKSRL